MSDESTKPGRRGFASGQGLDAIFPFGRGTDRDDADATEPARVDVGSTGPAAPDPVDPSLNLDRALLAMSRRRPRPITPRLAPQADSDPEDAPPPRQSGAGSDAEDGPGRWPTQDDRVAAVRRLIPRPQLESPLVSPPKIKSALPEPEPEPRRVGSQRRVSAATAVTDRLPHRRFRPVEPSTLEGAGLDEGLIEALVVKHLYQNAGASGRALAFEIGLRPTIVTRFLEELKMRRLAVHRSAAAMGDFYYELTEEGRSVAREIQKDSRYAGPAPVPLDQYVDSVKAQAISTEHPRRAQLLAAFSDLLVSEDLLSRIGPALTHGKGMFMFGPPGNGKTSLAERITGAYSSTVYIPHAIYAGGQIIQVFDPAVHDVVEEPDASPTLSHGKPDRRWVRCRRPTVVVGGELTLEALDISYDELDGVCEAPIQLKANGGTLVIDDFGRQRCRPDELLNRWIVPLEKQVDYIALPGGRKEAFPFECLLIFSTNMEPRELVDEAFLRRIPYKIEVKGPSEAHFRELLAIQCAELNLLVEDGAVDYLLSEHFTKAGRATRYCHPRDLMMQIYNLCRFREEPGIVTRETIDQAVLLYFSLL
ncbi:MAG: hypothetical protein GXP62_07720 [Oligoflexia bacterium]|nr:hypothetical protein [Oligoflexia bacterium]